MKKLFSIIAVICLCSAFVFAQDEGDEYDDGYVYELNGAGDQFLNINLGANFPVNFGKQIYPGLNAGLGYYRFITNNLALGGDALVGYNLTIGKKSLVTVPVTFGAMYQPTINKFEFPLSLSIGLATTTCQGLVYFPSLAAKASAGAFYRFFESWSFGISSYIYWIPQWDSDPSKSDHGIFATAGLTARYHF